MFIIFFVVVGILGFFLPRLVLGAVACWFFGGWWLFLLVPATFLGLIIDYLNITD